MNIPPDIDLTEDRDFSDSNTVSIIFGKGIIKPSKNCPWIDETDESETVLYSSSNHIRINIADRIIINGNNWYTENDVGTNTSTIMNYFVTHNITNGVRMNFTSDNNMYISYSGNPIKPLATMIKSMYYDHDKKKFTSDEIELIKLYETMPISKEIGRDILKSDELSGYEYKFICSSDELVSELMDYQLSRMEDGAEDLRELVKSNEISPYDYKYHDPIEDRLVFRLRTDELFWGTNEEDKELENKYNKVIPWE